MVHRLLSMDEAEVRTGMSRSRWLARTDRPRLAVLMPMAWSIRNVIYSGILQRLSEAGTEVHLLLYRFPEESDTAASRWLAPAASCKSLLVPCGHSPRGKAFLDGIIRSAFNKRNRIRSYRIYQRWLRRHGGPTEQFRGGLIDCLGILAQPAPLFGALCRRSERQYRRIHNLDPVQEQLKALAPDLVWSTVSVSAREYPYLLAARDLKIPVVASIHSFDNLTSRSVIPESDHYLVWSETMKDQLMRLYPRTISDQVTVTGTPQFDFHRWPSSLWPRETTLRRLGLPRQARFFLHAASHGSLAPEEPSLVAQISQRMRADDFLRDYWLVVRLHPLESDERWRAVRENGGRVVLSRPWNLPPDAEGWTFAMPEEQACLISSLVHAEACVNIASTMTLDAAILDRPVIGIEFSSEPGCPRDILYEEYGAEHYLPLVRSGGLRVARRWSDLLALMRQAICHPGQDHEKRVRMVETECGLVDGRAGERVSDTLVRLVSQPSNAMGPARV
jgi:hypothetical protein